MFFFRAPREKDRRIGRSGPLANRNITVPGNPTTLRIFRMKTYISLFIFPSGESVQNASVTLHLSSKVPRKLNQVPHVLTELLNSTLGKGALHSIY